MNNTLVLMAKYFDDYWKKKIFLTGSWLSGLLSAEIFISTGACGGPDANTDRGKQLISAVRVSGGNDECTFIVYSVGLYPRQTTMQVPYTKIIAAPAQALCGTKPSAATILRLIIICWHMHAELFCDNLWMYFINIFMVMAFLWMLNSCHGDGLFREVAT